MEEKEEVAEEFPFNCVGIKLSLIIKYFATPVIFANNSDLFEEEYPNVDEFFWSWEGDKIKFEVRIGIKSSKLSPFILPSTFSIKIFVEKLISEHFIIIVWIKLFEGSSIVIKKALSCCETDLF